MQFLRNYGRLDHALKRRKVMNDLFRTTREN